ncbi:hypothetical protein [Aliivibrio fischeri]|uniref:hypothetical protein n=1 Tax=Aliivibrio fischeri TaxID=668 RepID=UPI0007C56E2D|nr:hypothetical protein [Aliivibrio fischeri]
MASYGGSCSNEQKSLLISMLKTSGVNSETELIFLALEEYALNRNTVVQKKSPCDEIDYLQKKARENGAESESDLLFLGFSAFER